MTLIKASTPNLRNLILQFTHNTFLSVYLTKNKGYTHPKISLHIPFWRLQLKSVQTTAEVCTDYTCSLHRLRRVLNFSARTQGSVYVYLPKCLRVGTNLRRDCPKVSQNKPSAKIQERLSQKIFCDSLSLLKRIKS